MAADTPLPIAPADNIACSITIGNTTAIPASAGTPSRPTYAVSAIAATEPATIAPMFGRARRINSGRIAPASIGLPVTAMFGAGGADALSVMLATPLLPQAILTSDGG